MFPSFPYAFDANRRTAVSGRDDHVRQMLEQLLFTSPGERVNRPDFGSGLLQLVFAPNSPEMAAAIQFTTRAAIVRYLGDVVEIESLDVEADDSALRISLTYRVRSTGEIQTTTLERGL